MTFEKKISPGLKAWHVRSARSSLPRFLRVICLSRVPLDKQQIYYLWQSVAVVADREVFKRRSTYTFILAYLYAIDLKFSEFSMIRRDTRKQRSSTRNRYEIMRFFHIRDVGQFNVQYLSFIRKR